MTKIKTYKIDTDVPLRQSSWTTRKLNNPLRIAVSKMKVGHSIVVENSGVASRAVGYMKEIGKNGATRKEGSNVRVHMIENGTAKPKTKSKKTNSLP